MKKTFIPDPKIKKLYLVGKSAQEIATRLNLPLHIVYKSLRSENVQRRSAKEQNKIRFEKSPKSYSFKNNLSRNERDLMVAAVMLYYGEGAKTQNTVDFANSDQEAVGLFLKFLRTICRVDENKLRFYLYCFSDQDSKQLIQYWSRRLAVNENSFTKPYIRASNNTLKRSMPYGVLHVRYSDKRLLHHILSLMKTITTELG